MMDGQPANKIELLSVELLNQHRPQVIELRKLAKSLRLELGWHYLLDQTWILSQLEGIAGKRILDAGAGTGLIQWYLAQHGAQVISVDRGSRVFLPVRFRTRFRVRGLRPGDLAPTREVLRKNLRGPAQWSVKAANQTRDLLSLAEMRRSKGSVVIYNQDLMNLKDLPDQSIDAVVAVSALEHNPPENLERVVSELMRVLKPGGRLVASLNAAREADWWHTPSSGWCYSEASLRRLFCLPEDTPANYDRYDELFAALKGSAELRDNLAGFYARSGDNGMPWGKWDPQYIPVGVCKVKA